MDAPTLINSDSVLRVYAKSNSYLKLEFNSDTTVLIRNTYIVKLLTEIRIYSYTFHNIIKKNQTLNLQSNTMMQ